MTNYHIRVCLFVFWFGWLVLFLRLDQRRDLFLKRFVLCYELTLLSGAGEVEGS